MQIVRYFAINGPRKQTIQKRGWEAGQIKIHNFVKRQKLLKLDEKSRAPFKQMNCIWWIMGTKEEVQHFKSSIEQVSLSACLHMNQKIVEHVKTCYHAKLIEELALLK